MDVFTIAAWTALFISGFVLGYSLRALISAVHRRARPVHERQTSAIHARSGNAGNNEVTGVDDKDAKEVESEKPQPGS
jgi:hypothetical protein